MSFKMECNRCYNLKMLWKYVARSEKKRMEFTGKGMFELASWLVEELERLDADIAIWQERPCKCQYVEQLPFGNTGVKISAFPAGIAQEEIKNADS